MTSDFATLRPLLQSGDFRGLLNNLGWDTFDKVEAITVRGETFNLQGVAHKRGAQVFVCSPGADGRVPERSIRGQIGTQLRKIARENVIIFVDRSAPPRHQLWQWVEVETGKPARLNQDEWHHGHSGDRLLQKLDIIKVELDEENDVTLAGTVLPRLKDAFGSRDKVTKKFFERFQQEHKKFLGFIEGIAAQGDRDWYASVMLNRLMFVYFIQKKRFLDDDLDYLNHRLKQVQSQRGKGQFHSFYRAFLRRLFHEGLGTPEGQRANGLETLIGKVPYLNGGIFDEHKLERDYEGIEIPDEAFESVFAFFDSYDWHLDDRPLRSDREINPDVLGYIFEKYINQKQMGAYYTKEDITEYITKNTVLPFLLERTRENCKVAFQPGGPVWSLLSTDPDRYIYPAVRKGVVDVDGNVIPLPEDIDPGVADVSKRGGWNRPAPAPYALPTETWREHVARRQRCLELREKLRNGEVIEVNDLITYNLNIRQFAQDVIEQSEGPDVVKAFYDALEGVSVLDPTCGSGAFLFAALQVLEPLYEACLDRMEAWLADEERLGRNHHGHRFRAVLESVAKHPNREYFIYKSIVINNLYGVDIMEEAVEICKLRLFLKLVSTVEDADQVEPLPDVDFNIRAGNTLVGFTSLDAVRQAMSVDARGNRRLLFEEEEQELRDIEERAASADRAYRLFRDAQVNPDGKVDPAAKLALRDRLDDLDDRLNHHLARQYGVDPEDETAYDAWRHSHQPLHWFVEFHEVMSRGGFDAIVGNPPYLEDREVGYEVTGFVTFASGAVHAWCIERANSLLSQNGAMSMIVPLALVCTQRMRPVQDVLESGRSVHYANFAWRPGRLFDTVNRALTIFVATPAETRTCFATGYRKWNSESRDTVIETVSYTHAEWAPRTWWVPKLSAELETGLLRKVLESPTTLDRLLPINRGEPVYYRTTGGLYWKVFTSFPPLFRVNGEMGRSSRETKLPVGGFDPKCVALVLSSSLFWWWYTLTSNLRDLNPSDIRTFPVPETALRDPRLAALGAAYEVDMRAHSTMLQRIQKQTGVTETQSFRVSASKPILDSADEILGHHYGLSPEELDFIINYDIKYRMGADDGDDGGN